MGNLPENGEEEHTNEKAAAGPEKETELEKPEKGTEPPEDGTKLPEDPESEESESEEGYVGRGFGMGFLAGVLTALLCVCVFLLGWRTAQRVRLTRQGEDQSEGAEDIGAEVLTDYHTLSKLDEIQNLIEQNYLRDVDSDTLSEYLFRGIAYGLEDDYADYYSPPELNTVLEATRGVYFGIGITIEEDAQTQEIRIVEVYDGSPAAEAGLEAGDIISEVNGTLTEEMDLSGVTDLIRSQEDSFSLKVLRDGSGELEVELKCDTVEPTYVESEMIADPIGYVRITDFTGSAVGQFRDALKELDGQGMEKLIIDLRDNPGGLLDSVRAMLDDILPEGLIVYTEDRNGKREELSSDEKQLVSCEIAVLVNGGSASASEIFAGAVQDYELGPIIGTQTYGKGVVQDTFTLSDGSAFKMTTKEYFTPKGRNIDGNGITPDIVVEDGPLDVAQGGDADSGETNPDTEDGNASSGASEILAARGDAVLAKALETLKAQD